MSAPSNKKGGYTPPTSDDLFGVNNLTNEEKLKDWEERRRRFEDTKKKSSKKKSGN